MKKKTPSRVSQSASQESTGDKYRTYIHYRIILYIRLNLRTKTKSLSRNALTHSTIKQKKNVTTTPDRLYIIIGRDENALSNFAQEGMRV